MKRQLIALSLIAAMPAVVSAADAGVAYPAGYWDWHHVKSMVIEQGHPLYDAFGGIHHLYANRKAMEGYRSGRFADGAVIVFGPFMSAAAREAFKERAAKFRNIRTLTFTNNLGALMQRAAGVVAMGGYNTFCEILSFGKPALLVPRTTPRLEQYLRAERAEKLGLVRMLANDGVRPPERMAAALRELPQMRVPAESVRAAMLEGLGRISSLIAPWLEPRGEVHDLRRCRSA